MTGQHHDYDDGARQRHRHNVSEGYIGGAEGANAESSYGSLASGSSLPVHSSMHNTFGQYRTSDNFYDFDTELLLHEFQLGTIPTINEDQDSQRTITPDTQSTPFANANPNQASTSQMSASGQQTSGFSTPSQTRDWTSSYSSYHMEHPRSLPASGSGFSTPSQSSESSLSHDVHSPYRIEPTTSSISHSGLLTRNVHRQPSIQAHLSSDSVSPTSSYIGPSFQNMKVRSYPNSPASSGSPFLSPISPAFPQGIGFPLLESRDAPRMGMGRADGFYNQFNSAPGPSSTLATLGFGERSQRQLDTDVTTYSHADQIQAWKDIPWTSPIAPGQPRVFVPQKMYRPHTSADHRRYVEGLPLMAPVVFEMKHPDQYGVNLSDALTQRMTHLQDKDELMFKNCGPSASIRIEWPGMMSWSRQIPTKDFRNPAGPITKAKLATQIARTVKRFIKDSQGKPFHDEDDANAVIFRLGTGQHNIKFEDIILVSLHHVSQGSWQPHLRLRRQP